MTAVFGSMQSVALSGLKGVAISSGNGGSNGLFYTTNGGASWTVSDQPNAVGLDNKYTNQFVCIDDNNALALSLTGPINAVLYYSSNGGQNWSVSTGPTLTGGVSFPGTIGYGEPPSMVIKGSNALFSWGSNFLYSSNAGATWSYCQFGTLGSSTDITNAMNSISLLTTGQVVAVKSSPGAQSMLYSIDYGQFWTATSGFPTDAYLTVCSMNNSGTVIYGVNNPDGVTRQPAYYSNNYGISVTAATGLDLAITNGFEPQSMVIDLTSNKCFCIKSNGTVYYSNTGNSWALSILGSGVTINTGNPCAVKIVGDNAIAGITTRWIYSNDGGASWSNSATDVSGIKKGCADLTSAGNGIMSNSTELYYTSNNGINWLELPLPPTVSNITPNSGNKDGGTTVTITGTGFTGTSGVTFGGNAATSLVVTDTTITCVTPAGSAGSVDVVVLNSSGNITVANGFTYNIICFKEGSKILTDKGYVAVQDLRNGDLVKTVSSGFKKIEHIGYSKMYHNVNDIRSKDKLYKCCISEYPELTEDLVITGCHSILIKNFKDHEQIEKTQDVLGKIYITETYYRLPACVDDRTKIFEEEGVHTIWHFSLEHNDYYMNYGVYANGLLVETTSNRMMLELSGMTLV